MRPKPALVPGELRAVPLGHSPGSAASCASYRANLSSPSPPPRLRATCAPAQRQLSLGCPDSAHHRAPHLPPSLKNPTKIHKTKITPTHTHTKNNNNNKKIRKNQIKRSAHLKVRVNLANTPSPSTGRQGKWTEFAKEFKLLYE